MRKIAALLLTLLLLFSLTCCGAASDGESMTGGRNDTAGSATEGNDLSERKIIRRVTVNMETKDFDGTLDKLNASMASAGAYAESINEYSRSGSRRATYVIRVPSENLDSFLTSLAALGSVLSRTESAEDVTLAYVDVESRIKALKAEESALTEMLENADDLSSLLDIRSRLTEVRYQLDSYESQLRKYDNLIDYSTVTVSIAEVERLANIRGGVWSQIGDDFMDNVYAIADAFVAFFIWFVGSIPVFAVIGVFGTGFFLLFRHIHRRRQAKAIAAVEAAKKKEEEK